MRRDSNRQLKRGGLIFTTFIEVFQNFFPNKPLLFLCKSVLWTIYWRVQLWSSSTDRKLLCLRSLRYETLACVNAGFWNKILRAYNQFKQTVKVNNWLHNVRKHWRPWGCLRTYSLFAIISSNILEQCLGETKPKAKFQIWISVSFGPK